MTSDDLLMVRDLLRIQHRIPKAAAMLRAQRLSATEREKLFKAAESLHADRVSRGATITGGGEVREPVPAPPCEVETDTGD